MQAPVDAPDRYTRRIDFLLKFYKVIMEDQNEREPKESTCGERKS